MQPTNIERAFQDFIDNPLSQTAIDRATESLDRWLLELFPNGKWRVIKDEGVGSLYNSPGVLITIPQLTSEEWDEDPDLRFYDNAIEFMQNILAEIIAEIEAEHGVDVLNEMPEDHQYYGAMA